jgi:hypothetical protein
LASAGAGALFLDFVIERILGNDNRLQGKLTLEAALNLVLIGGGFGLALAAVSYLG